MCGTLHLHTARQRLAPVHQSRPPHSAHPMAELQAAHQLPGRSHTASEATKPLARRLSAAIPAATHRTPHPNTSMRHRSRPPLRPAPTPQPSPSQTLSGGVSAVPRAPVAPGRWLPPALSDSARDAAAAKMEIICAHTETGISATKARRYYAQRVPHHLGALSRPRRPVGPMRDGSGTGAPEPRALTVADTLHRQLQPLPPHPDRPMQRAPHLLRQAPGAPGPTRPPKQEKQAPTSLSWAATRAGGRQDR